MAPTTKQIPMFFKCFIRASEKLCIPESWCSYMGSSIPVEAFLRNRHGDIWEVKVANYQNTNEFWFEKGWTTFVEQNKLGYEDLVIFMYDGASTFDFKLFDNNGDEKEYVRIPRSKEDKDMEQLQDMELEQVAEVQNSRSTRNTGNRKRAPAITKADEEAIFQSGFRRPNNPYFVTKRGCKRKELYVPASIAADFKLTLLKEIGILDEKGHEWPGRVGVWKDNRLWISRGWKAYCKWNNVKKGDWCIIEIVRPETPHVQIYFKALHVPAAALSPATRS